MVDKELETTYIIVNDDGELIEPDTLTAEFTIAYLNVKTESAALKKAEQFLVEEGQDVVVVYKLVPAFKLVQAKPTIHRLDEDD